MTIILGESGVGKSVQLKLILGLLCPDEGTIRVNGQRIDNMREQDLIQVRGEIGMVFQELALFDSLTVAENVGYRLSEEMRWPRQGAQRVSRTSSASSDWPISSTASRPSCRAASAAAWRSQAPWRQSRT